MEPKKIVKTILFALSFVVITIAYNNCGAPNSSASHASLSSVGNGEIVAIPNTKTASTVRASRVLDTLVSCLGTIKASNASRNEWINSKGSISEEGLANSITPPMVKSLVSISAEVCNDLVNKERNQADADRIVFRTIDFNSGTLTSAQMTNVSKRISRSCWGRNPSSDEVSSIVSSISSAFSGAQNNGQTTTRKMIYLCTAMAASFATYEM